MNGFTGSSDIANAFADKYHKLYTSVPTVPYEIQALKSYIIEDISSCNEHEVEGILSLIYVMQLLNQSIRNQMA